MNSALPAWTLVIHLFIGLITDLVRGVRYVYVHPPLEPGLIDEYAPGGDGLVHGAAQVTYSDCAFRSWASGGRWADRMQLLLEIG